MMASCSQFIRDFSDYRDGLMTSEERAEIDAHLEVCASCAGYARVVERGIRELQTLPSIEPSDDFLPRLQHRIYSIQDRPAWLPSGNTSGTSLGFVVAVVLLISTAAWLPVMRPKAPLVELPPAVALAPRQEVPVHTLFRAGPLLAPVPETRLLSDTGTPTLFSRYTPLRAQAYRTEAIRPR